MRTADRAWLVLGAGVVGYDLSARDGELMSEAVDRYLLRRPWLTRAVIAVTAAHLANVIPARCDPFTFAWRIRRAWHTRVV